MSGFRKFLNACFLASLISAAGTACATAGVRITITYDEVKTEISPFQRTFSTSERRVYSLNGSEVGFSGSGGFKTAAGMRLGKDLESDSDSGMHFKLKYSVVNGSLVVFSDFPSYTTTRTINTNQKDSCTSTLIYSKKPGHPNFEVMSAGHPVLLSDMHAENMSCSIAETSN